MLYSQLNSDTNSPIDLTTPELRCAVLQCVYAGDEPELFRRSVHSVKNQRLHGAAVDHYLAIDGELPSDLEEVVDAERNAFRTIMRFENNRGLAECLNSLIQEVAEYEYIFRMDSDDLALRGRFETQIKFMQANKDVDVCGTAIIERGRYGDIIGVRVFPAIATLRDIARGVPVAHPTACFRKGFFQRFGLYPTNIGNEDIALWFNVARKGGLVANLSEPLLMYTLSDKTLSRRDRRKALGELMIYVRGVYDCAGVSSLMVFPLARYVFRHMPSSIVEYVYRSGRMRNGGYVKGDRRSGNRAMANGESKLTA